MIPILFISLLSLNYRLDVNQEIQEQSIKMLLKVYGVNSEQFFKNYS